MSDVLAVLSNPDFQNIAVPMLRDTLRYVIGRAMERYKDAPDDLRKKAESNFEDFTKPFSSELAERFGEIF